MSPLRSPLLAALLECPQGEEIVTRVMARVEGRRMNWTDYQRACDRTVPADMDTATRLANFALGLCGEAGEAGEVVKKHLFHGHALDPEKLRTELGDVLWYVATLATTAGLDLGDIAGANIAKLRARYPEGFSTEASVARVDAQPPRGCANEVPDGAGQGAGEIVAPAAICAPHDGDGRGVE